jgi:MerR family redox-sensitive transcriptional activator SoxR
LNIVHIVILEVNFKSSRISVIRVAQNLGLTLGEIAASLKNLPDQRTPTKRDWERLARSWESLLDARISKLEF